MKNTHTGKGKAELNKGEKGITQHKHKEPLFSYGGEAETPKGASVSRSTVCVCVFAGGVGEGEDRKILHCKQLKIKREKEKEWRLLNDGSCTIG